MGGRLSIRIGASAQKGRDSVTNPLHKMSAVDLSAAFEAGELSPVEVARACLARITTRDPKREAFCYVDGAASVQMAAESEARWVAGEPLSPLDGVPVAIKEIFDVAGCRCG